MTIAGLCRSFGCTAIGVMVVMTLMPDTRAQAPGVVAAAKHAHADVIAHDRRALLDHVLFEQMHQEINFRLRPFPVFAGEAVKRELLDHLTRVARRGPRAIRRRRTSGG